MGYSNRKFNLNKMIAFIENRTIANKSGCNYDELGLKANFN